MSKRSGVPSRKRLPSQKAFAARIGRAFAAAFALILFSLILGGVGYHYLENIPWLDAFLNASMILTGMGPVAVMQTSAGKLFAIFYSLFSGVVFLGAVAVMFAPIFHRFLHRFHLDMGDDDSE